MKKKRYLLSFIFLLLLFAMPVQSHAKVRLNMTSKDIYARETFTLKVKGTLRKASWTSSNSKVASVSSKGKVTGKDNGKATITAKVGKKKYRCTVTVLRPMAAYDLNVYKDDSRIIEIANKDAFNTIEFSTSNAGIATVSETGEVTAVKPGYCKINIKTNGFVSHIVDIHILDFETYSTVTMMRGGHITLDPPAYRNLEAGSYQVINADRGYVNDGVYYAADYGFNQVVYTNGQYVHHFTIKSYCWEAHRGYHATKAENTLDAIRAAKKAGASAVEIDVRATKDGKFIVMHDSKLSKKTTLKGYVKSKTLAQIQKKPYIRYKGKKYYVPSLEQALSLCKELNLNVAVEMKTIPGTGYGYSKKYMVEQLCSLIKKYGNERTSVILTSVTNVNDFLKYSDGSIIGRIPNSNYWSSSSGKALRALANKYSYLMSSEQFGHLCYNDLILCQDNPIK
ncbi:MAG: glycerophosphodiester phosphodiesterase family protein [Eubacteriales bacterium]|nr:glycerophosphodiester phosphodiesterase family protein [Eubacteriales bacterium]